MNDLVTGVGTSSGQAVAANLTASSGTRTAPTFNLAHFALDRVQKVMVFLPAPPAVAAQLVSVNDQACDVSGNVSYTWNDKDNNSVLSVDDEISGSFTQCVDFPNTTVNGKFSFTLHGLIGDPTLALSAWWLSASLAFDQLRVTEGAKSWTFNTRKKRQNTTTHNNETNTNTQTRTTLDVAGAQDTTTFGNFSYQFTNDRNTLASTLQGSGALVRTQLNGRVAFLPLTMFEGSGNDFPTAGSMKINGAKHADATVSSGTFTASGGNNVTLAIDTSGDGVADDTSNTTWGVLGLCGRRAPPSDTCG